MEDVNSQIASNHVVRGTRVLSKIVPDVTDTRRRHPWQRYTPTPPFPADRAPQCGHSNPSGHRSQSRYARHASSVENQARRSATRPGCRQPATGLESCGWAAVAWATTTPLRGVVHVPGGCRLAGTLSSPTRSAYEHRSSVHPDQDIGNKMDTPHAQFQLTPDQVLVGVAALMLITGVIYLASREGGI